MALNLLTVYTNDSTQNLEDVEVQVYNEEVNEIITTGLTNNSGEVVFSLPENETYNLFFFKQGYTFSNLPKVVTLDSNVIISVTANKVPEITVPAGMVNLYGFLKNFNEPFVAQTVKLHLTKTPQTKQNTTFGKAVQTTLSDENGYFNFLVPGNLHVTLTIPSCNFMQSGLLPYTGQFEYTNLGL